MAARRKRILIAVDGSDQAFEVVAYISKAVSLWEMEATLLHIMDKVPDTFWDWEKDPIGPQYTKYMKGYEVQKEQQIRSFMEKARDVLLHAGLPEQSVRIVISPRKEGIARDILAEAHKGYDILAIGRRGLGAIDETILGSVANKILFNLSNVTICLVGGKPKIGKILIGMDSSTGSARAGNFVGKMLSASNPSVTLANVLRLPMEYDELISETEIQKLIENAQKNLKPAFNKVTKSLVSSGVDPKRIITKVITGARSRAVALVDEAKHGRYGAIVLGRKGVSEVPEFQMGRVVTKLVHTAREMAVWIVA